MDFIPSGWRRDLIHMVGCFYASQISPLNNRQWCSDRDKFMQAMEECKDCKWLDIKELSGLGLHNRWIWPRSDYHWKVAELDQLQYCPHL